MEPGPVLEVPGVLWGTRQTCPHFTHRLIKFTVCSGTKTFAANPALRQDSSEEAWLGPRGISGASSLKDFLTKRFLDS